MNQTRETVLVDAPPGDAIFGQQADVWAVASTVGLTSTVAKATPVE